MSAYRIPFNKPCLAGNELTYVSDAVQRGNIAGDGYYTHLCRDVLAQELHVADVVLTTSGTHALEMIALLLRLGPGDEVILPSFTFVSTANAFVLRGARPVFADIRPDTLNLDEKQLPELISPRTRAIVPVHYAGVACEMDTILDIARKEGIAVVEDNAHGLFATYKGRYLGTIGSLGAQSFHETKNIICGEGGALVISDSSHAERADYIREKGTNRNRFFRGQVDKYTWVDVGSSYVISDILAAFLYAQLEAREMIRERRKRIWDRYYEGLSEWAARSDVKLPSVPDECGQSFHMFYLVLPSLEARRALIDELKSHGILSVFHYSPLHMSDMGLSYGGRPGACPIAEAVSDRLLRLPFYNDLSEGEQDEVIERVTDFRLPAGTRAEYAYR